MSQVNHIYAHYVPAETVSRAIEIMTVLFQKPMANDDEMCQPHGEEIWTIDYDKNSWYSKPAADECAKVRFWCDKSDMPVVREALSKKYLYAKAF